MELEIKHLTLYLPYGLKMKVLDTFYKYDIMTLCDKSGLSNIGLPCVIDEPQDFKPILRPLSDIERYFKPIFENDEDINRYLSEEYLSYFGIEINNIHDVVLEYLPYGVFNVLIKHHFDVFGLIEKGLAVDINTLSV
jgi:hypothetical protein